MSLAPSTPGAKKRPGDKRSERERAMAVCARMADSSLSVQEACRAEALDNGSFFRLVRKDDELRIEYEAAREACIENRITALHTEADEMIMQAKRKGAGAGPMVSAFTTKANIAKWEAERLMPKKYGTRVDVNHSGSIDLAGRLAKARERTKE